MPTPNARSKPKSRAVMLREWSVAVRARTGNKCCVCGSDRYVQAHHILPKERYPELQYELLNGVPLCARCHKFGKYSAHRNPVWFAMWLMQCLDEAWQWALAHVGERDA